MKIKISRKEFFRKLRCQMKKIELNEKVAFRIYRILIGKSLWDAKDIIKKVNDLIDVRCVLPPQGDKDTKSN